MFSVLTKGHSRRRGLTSGRCTTPKETAYPAPTPAAGNADLRLLLRPPAWASPGTRHETRGLSCPAPFTSHRAFEIRPRRRVCPGLVGGSVTFQRECTTLRLAVSQLMGLWVIPTLGNEENSTAVCASFRGHGVSAPPGCGARTPRSSDPAPAFGEMSDAALTPAGHVVLWQQMPFHAVSAVGWPHII